MIPEMAKMMIRQTLKIVNECHCHFRTLEATEPENAGPRRRGRVLGLGRPCFEGVSIVVCGFFALNRDV